MKLRINWHKEHTIAFCELEIGDTFSFGGDLYMKIRPVRGEENSILWNSIHLATGGLVWHGSNTVVKLVSIEINVEEIKDE